MDWPEPEVFNQTLVLLKHLKWLDGLYDLEKKRWLFNSAVKFEYNICKKSALTEKYK